MRYVQIERYKERERDEREIQRERDIHGWREKERVSEQQSDGVRMRERESTLRSELW